MSDHFPGNMAVKLRCSSSQFTTWHCVVLQANSQLGIRENQIILVDLKNLTWNFKNFRQVIYH